MAKESLSGKLAVILHADVAGSTALVQQDKELAHERIQDAFKHFRTTIEKYQGSVVELRGDALLAEFERASDAVTAALAFQGEHTYHISRLKDDLRPTVRVGIAIGEVIVADNTVTGAGVVQAQRIEQIADPGGVCITAAIHEALSKRIPLDLENLGEQVLKGFDDPVRVYRVELSAGESIPIPNQTGKIAKPSSKPKLIVAAIVIALLVAGGAAYWLKTQGPTVEVASIERMAFPLPDKPSIAVLPFTNMSDDAQQEYFADGMTEDLITDISKLSGLFVIARNSVFTYKGKAVKVRQVAEELGVRYVMEGSVRRVGNQVRINAQLIDATTGGHIWADRYDGPLDDVFTMQDKITRNIVNALSITLTSQEEESQTTESISPEAHDAYLRGWERYRQGTPDDLAKSISHLEQAIKLDPNYRHAQTALAAVYWKIILNGWWKNLGFSREQATELSRISLRNAMEAPSALAHQIASERAALFQRNPKRALAEAELALALDTNDPAGHLAMTTALQKAGKGPESIVFVRNAMRLDPHHPAYYFNRLGQSQYLMGQYENAAMSLEEAAKRNPNDEWTFVYLTATYGQLGKKDEARRVLEEANALRAESGWGPLTLQTASVESRGGRRYLFKWFGDYKHLREGFRKAGVPNQVNWFALIIQEQLENGTRVNNVKGATTIDAEEAKALHERGVPFVDTDFRWLKNRIPAAHYLDVWGYELNEVTLQNIADKNQEIVIYSSRDDDITWVTEAVARAVTWGFQKVYYFRDGLEGWEKAGYPVDTEKK